MIVAKFGGSSVDGAEGIERVAGIVRAMIAIRGGARRENEWPVVVVSAMAKTTRHLLASAEEAAAGNLAAALARCASLEAFHRAAAAAVPAAGLAAAEAAVERSFVELRALLASLAETRRLTPAAADAAAAHGELMSSAILAQALPRFGVDAAWIDCRQVIVTDDAFTRARPLYDETGRLLRAAIPPLLARGKVPVLGGYVGATREGATTTLGKEGSDFSAAIVGAALGAREVRIWTDVDGILSADPRLVPSARRVRTLSFAEALELSCSGAKKPHPGTLEPARRGGIPIRILNSLAAGGEGTLIGRRGAAPPTIKSIACRANDHLIHAMPESAGAIPAGGFVPAVLGVAERLRPALLVLSAAPDAVHLALDHAERLAEVRAALAGVSRVGVVRGRAVISLVSEDLALVPELAARALAAAREFEPRLVVTGAAAPAVRCLVEEEDMPAAVAAIHRRLFPDPAPGAAAPAVRGSRLEVIE
ncbi:MAG TPA: aspartate kinase [Thermoanaerobaculia bacterium]|nr:aspartate kinase [Thermoanaerobaculia bacterium]